MRHHRLIAAAVVTLAIVAATLQLSHSPRALAALAGSSYTVQPLHFRVTVGPNRTTTCDIVGDLYLPRGASPTSRVPALLMSNGWGGSKDTQSGIARAFANEGYAALTYSGLGWGGSGCRIQMNDPRWDGAAASQLVSYLGGAPNIAYLDAAHSIPAPRLTSVRRDRFDHDGLRRKYDPRVGMIGGSYGGGVQFAAASVDHRIDTIVPLVTYNDLSYSLWPNGATTTRGVSTNTPGAFKTIYGTGLLGTGAAGSGTDPQRLLGCPNLVDRFCTDMATSAVSGTATPDTVAFFRGVSVASFTRKIKVPVLLAQGQKDSLVNLNESVATYRALKAQGTPVKMIWHSWGHSNGAVGAPGEFDIVKPDLVKQYEWKRIHAWMEHYLRDSPIGTGPRFSYFRDWVHYTGSARRAYATSSSFPVGTPRRLYLGGNGKLTSSTAAVIPGSLTFITPPAGLPTSVDPIDVLTGTAPAVPQLDLDAPGTAISWNTRALRRPLDVVGIPRMTLKVDAPGATLLQGVGPAGRLVIFIKLLDVAPNGTASLVGYQVTPVRIPDVTKSVKIALGGIVHRFKSGHRLRLTIAGGSSNHRGNLVPTTVSVSSTPTQILDLPIVKQAKKTSRN